MPLLSIARRLPIIGSHVFPPSTVSIKHRAFTGSVGSSYIPPATPVSESAPFLRQVALSRQAAESPSAFWLDAARMIDWKEAPTVSHDFPYSRMSPLLSNHARWFPDGKVNMSYNCLDRHVEAGRGDRTAIIFDSPVSGTVEYLSYADTLESTKRVANVLRNEYGVQKGDRVLIYMPNMPEAIHAMQACARIGATHSVVFGGFAPKEVAKRVIGFKPKVIITASCGVVKGEPVPYVPLLREALRISSETAGVDVHHTLVFQRNNLYTQTDLDASRGEKSWDQVYSRSQAAAECEWVESNHPLYVLHTSGTTKDPKAVQRDTGGHATALLWNTRNFFGLTRVGEGCFFAASELGWILGSSYCNYGVLLNGSTSVLLEGKVVGTPDPSTFYRVIDQHRPDVLFTAPTALTMLRREDPTGIYRWRGKQVGAGGVYDFSSLKGIYVGGERCIPDVLRWFRRMVAEPVPGANPEQFARAVVAQDNFWQTETGSPVLGACIGFDPSERVAPRDGSAGMPVPGYNLKVLTRHEDALDGADLPTSTQSILDPSYHEAAPNETGSIVSKLPLPPGAIMAMYPDNFVGFAQNYLSDFPGHYSTGDSGHRDEDGYFHVMSRDTDIINVAAHRLSTGAFEATIVSCDERIAEAVVVGRNDPIRGSVPVAFVVLRGDSTSAATPEMRALIVASVRREIGAVACMAEHNIIFVQRLPKTRSGKVLRRMLRQMLTIVIDSSTGDEVVANKTVPDKFEGQIPATIEDDAVVAEMYDAIRTFGAIENSNLQSS
ncbi:acetyl-CoA synthetase-like protein [Ramicandelaber brevisporus]|nr:acetyl-CoA synthetase-like protein [Ramicandelaber brevisporus]